MKSNKNCIEVFQLKANLKHRSFIIERKKAHNFKISFEKLLAVRSLSKSLDSRTLSLSDSAKLKFSIWWSVGLRVKTNVSDRRPSVSVLFLDAPNQKWAGDISYIWTREGWLYLAVILDLHSWRVIGWAVSNRMKRDLAIRALKMAIAFQQPPKGCIHHTDRGSQYCSHDYQMDLSRNCAAPLAAYYAVKENIYGTETNGRI